MKTRQFIAIAFFSCGMISSCQVMQCGANKSAFLTKYDDFIDRVDRLDLEVSDEKWEKYDLQFKLYIED